MTKINRRKRNKLPCPLKIGLRLPKMKVVWMLLAKFSTSSRPFYVTSTFRGKKKRIWRASKSPDQFLEQAKLASIGSQ